MNRLRLFCAITMAMLFLATGGFSQQGTAVNAVNTDGRSMEKRGIDSMINPVIPLPAEIAANVKDLKASFDSVQTQKELVLSREKNIQALMLVQFMRACAKAKVDPDLYEWNEEITGIRPKAPAKK